MDPVVLAQCLKRVVMVRVSGPDYTRIKILGRPFYHADNGVTTLSASGLLVDEKKGIIITSATLLSPFMNFNARRGAKDNGKSFPKVLKKDTAVHVLFEESAQRQHFARDSDESDVALHDTSQWRAVTLLDVVPCQLVDACLKQLTGLSLNGQPGWEVGWQVASRDTPAGSVSPSDANTAQSCWRGFDHVAVLQLTDLDRDTWLDAHDWTQLKLANTERCERGEAVTMIGSPFGIISPPIFTNSTFQATISNVIRHPRPDQSTNQHAPCLLMLDQLCLPGCEGGPVFNQHGELVGLIAPPLRKSDSAGVEVNLIVTVNSFVPQLYEQHCHVPPPPSPPAAVANPVVEMIKSVQKSVALITVGAYWGSGILVSAEGHILTCAHLFRSLLVHNAPLSELKIDAAKEHDILSKFGKNLSTGQPSPPKSSKSHQFDPFNPQLQPGYKVEVRLDLLDSAQQYVHKWYSAELKYVSTSHWDLALLKLKNFAPNELNVTVEPIAIPDFESGECKEPQQGESIFVLGHGLFGPSKQMLPMSLNGIVSKIVYLRGKAQIIETSARVHRGVSGGILTNKLGQFVGLVTSNARQKDGRIVPNINFSIPARHLRALKEYLSAGDEELMALQSFEVRDEECAALWKLRLTAPHNIADDAVKPLFPPSLHSLPPPAAINSPESVAPRPPSNFYNFIARFEEQMSKPNNELVGAPLLSNTNTVPANNISTHNALKQPSIADLIKSKL